MKPLLVVNPAAGGGQTGRSFASMKSTIERALGPCEIAMTERAGHAVDLARQGALAGHPLVVAVGGDGTLHEVVNGLMTARSADYGTRASDVRLGLIAQGTGGDFRKTLGIEHRLDRYLDAIKSGRERPIDVGKLSGAGKRGHYFVNIVSAGLGGLVDRYVADASRTFGGKAAYFGASVKALANARLGNVRCTVTRGGETTTHAFQTYLVAICNGRYFGAGMMVAPSAELDDGLFDLVALPATTKLGFVLTSGGIYDGSHMKQPGLVSLRGEKLELELLNDDARDAFLVDLDGEPAGSLPLSVEVVPRAIVLRG